MAQIFTGGRFYFLLNIFFFIQIWYANFYSQEQGTVTLVAWFRPGGACVLGGWLRVTRPSALPGASSARAPLDRVQCEKRHAPIFSCAGRSQAGSEVKMRSVESKDSLSPSATRNTEHAKVSQRACGFCCRLRKLRQDPLISVFGHFCLFCTMV